MGYRLGGYPVAGWLMGGGRKKVLNLLRLLHQLSNSSQHLHHRLYISRVPYPTLLTGAVPYTIRLSKFLKFPHGALSEIGIRLSTWLGITEGARRQPCTRIPPLEADIIFYECEAAKIEAEKPRLRLTIWTDGSQQDTGCADTRWSGERALMTGVV